MWLCLNSAFFSIVEPSPGSSDLLVRARRKGDIDKVFPGAEVQRIPGRDYLYRATVGRDVVAEVVAEQVRGISYGNFKSSVKNRSLHDAYSAFWSIHADLQEVPPYSTRRRHGGLL